MASEPTRLVRRMVSHPHDADLRSYLAGTTALDYLLDLIFTPEIPPKLRHGGNAHQRRKLRRWMVRNSVTIENVNLSSVEGADGTFSIVGTGHPRPSQGPCEAAARG